MTNNSAGINGFNGPVNEENKENSENDEFEFLDEEIVKRFGSPKYFMS